MFQLFGMRVLDRGGTWMTALVDPAVADRVALSGVFEPDAPGAYAPNMVQAFVHTDVVAAGLLAFGQHVELQWHLPHA